MLERGTSQKGEREGGRVSPLCPVKVWMEEQLFPSARRTRGRRLPSSLSLKSKSFFTVATKAGEDRQRRKFKGEERTPSVGDCFEGDCLLLRAAFKSHSYQLTR